MSITEMEFPQSLLPGSMGSQAIQFLGQFPVPISHNYCRGFAHENYSANRTRRRRCSAGGRSGGSRWDWDRSANPNRGSRFRDGYVTDDYDEEDGFGFRNAAKQRVWWSDDVYAEDDEGFGVLEASIGFEWIRKVFRAFGWMIPAVIISLVMGTGSNTIIMALAVPLAQTALSLAAEALWGRARETPRPRSKSKKRPFAGRTRARKKAGNYKSWFEANNGSAKKETRNGQNFGGWDELDSQVRFEEEPRTRPAELENEARERVKISKRTKGDTPLLMRLLIAMFPYLGFWTKLF